jgi:hypothetical protein
MMMVDCPCCERPAKIYKRPLNSGMARALIWLLLEWREHMDWINIQEGPAWLLRSKQLPTLRYWGLVEPMPREPFKNSKGMWRPTLDGIAFAQNESCISKYVYVLFDQPVDFSDELVGIQDALGETFDYEELIHG